MHMADALVTPAVGVAMWAAAAVLTAASAKKLELQNDDRTVPLMGVLGAFVFAGQMLNFSIPLTGSSGHLGGGLLLAALLGPAGAFITIASILAVQALIFADGGLLAWGCNVINLGFWPCFVAYPLIFKPLVGAGTSKPRLWLASVIAAVVGFQLGAFSVVMETALSGVARLPVVPFLLLMQPIHLAIGLVEGLATAAILGFLHQARPELLRRDAMGTGRSLRPVLIGLFIGALLIGGMSSWFASANPDGLEWALRELAGSGAPVVSGRIHQLVAGSSTAGIIGVLLVFEVAGLAGLTIIRRRRAAATA